ncbi:MAG: glycosyltransferase family 39 protein [bacterium]|nr:glycosyltransferase family 39 protein [bacterium]
MMPENKQTQKETVFIFTLVAVCLILFFFNLGNRALWDIDEGKHAATSKDMVLSGDWVTPKYNGEKFYDKPPLHNWFVAISFLIFGFNEFAARLPAALLGMGCVFITYLLGRRIFGPTAAFLSSLVLASSVEFFVLSRTVVHDISLAFFITLALTLFYLGYENEKHRKPYFLVGYAAMGLSVLAKGPVGILLPAAIIGLFLILKKQLRFLREMQVGWGMLVVLAVAAPWYILISIKDPDYLSYFFLKQNFGNFFSADVRHPEPIYYYIPVLMGGMFPWSIFLPLALFRAIRARKSANNDGMLFALLWVAVIFIFFSLASSKLGTYLLPLFPAAALLVGHFLNDILINPSGDLDKGLIYSYLPLVIILPMALIYIILFPPANLMAETGIELKWVYLPAGGFIACCFISMGLAIRKKYRAFIGSMVGTVMTILLFSLIFLVPSIEPYRSSKYLAQKIDKLMDPALNLVFYLKARETFLFYTHRKATELESLAQLSKYMASDKQVFCIFKMDDWQDAEKLHEKMHIVVRKGNKLIASNRKPYED